MYAVGGCIEGNIGNISFGDWQSSKVSKLCLNFNLLGKQDPSASAYDVLRLVGTTPGQFETTW